MTDDTSFKTVDAYIDGLFVSEDDGLKTARYAAKEAGLPDIAVSPGQGKLLYLLARMIGASRILEVGTLGGYSTIWLARALPPCGAMVSLELSEAYADVARTALKLAGVGDVCDVCVGPAEEAMAELAGPFDMVFLDANKDSYPVYLQHAARVLRLGGLLVADNVVRAGAVLSPGDDVMAAGAAAFNQLLATDDRFEAVILQQVGIKGHDGLAIARRL